ncbi:hypothetical protein ACFQS7_02900 [Dankookia sp. GCM10030260]|uniref:hypothetical protein n=1 Tax=Dankookia sp. GCM10030260 TaxID=3273390 RepID=UPI003621740B
MAVKSPIEKAISDKPVPMHKKETLPISEEIEQQKPGFIDVENTKVTGVISWPKHFGLPQGNLADAFMVISHIYSPLPFDPNNAIATMEKIIDRSTLTTAAITEGPHDFANYRVTYIASAQAINWPNEFQQFQAASHNYLRPFIKEGIVWPATPNSGQGPKSIWPEEAAYVHNLDGPITGPGFRVRGS